jgi:hypothetical protein
MIKFIIIILLVIFIVYLISEKKELLTEDEEKDLRDFAKQLKKNKKQDSYLRKENIPIQCDSDSEILPTDDYCYKKCINGYEPSTTRCYMSCPDNMKQSLEYCIKNEPKYNTVCDKNQKRVGNFCVDMCSDNMLDVGFGCMKRSYFRKVDEETDKKCPEGKDRIGDRCYNKCLEGYKPRGKFCILE